MSVPWSQDELLANLTLLTREFMPRGVKTDWFLKKVRKMHRKGRLTYDALPPIWWFRLCMCDLRLGKYHWWGWDLRSEWACKLSEQDWWYPRWQGGPEDKCVLVLAEQGLGDEILYTSCLPDLLETGIRVIYECDWRLIPTFENSFSGNVRFVNRYVAQDDAKTEVPMTDNRRGLDEAIDCYIPAANLLQVFRKKPEDMMPRWGGWLKPRMEFSGWGTPAPTVGIAWGGRTGQLSPKALAKPFDHWDKINLQYDGTTHPDIRDVPQPSLTDTFDLIAGIDKVVSVTATPAHMAAATGVETEVINPPPRYVDADDLDSHNHNRMRFDWPPVKPHPWYGHHVRVYRSQHDWTRSDHTGLPARADAAAYG